MGTKEAECFVCGLALNLFILAAYLLEKAAAATAMKVSSRRRKRSVKEGGGGGGGGEGGRCCGGVDVFQWLHGMNCTVCLVYPIYIIGRTLKRKRRGRGE
jgi:hypothetical protein